MPSASQVSATSHSFTGQCGEAFFQSADPDDRKNRCTMSKSGDKVRCRAKLQAQ